MKYRIIRTKIKSIDCGVLDQTYLGPDATYVDLWRWYSTFSTIIHNQELIEDLGIPCGDDPENIGQHIDDWIWNRGEYQDRFDQILGPLES
jgi:hypothetical protein